MKKEIALGSVLCALILALLACASPLEEPLPTLAPTLTPKPVTPTSPVTPKPTFPPTKAVTPTITPNPDKLFGVNLIINGNAELDSGNGSCAMGPKGTLKGWQVESVGIGSYGSTAGDPDTTVPGPKDRGKCYFRKSIFGSVTPNPDDSMTQRIEVTAAGSLIDAKKVKYVLTAYLSGINAEGTSSLIATFQDANGQKIGEIATASLTADDPTGGVMLFETKREDVLPAGTRWIEIRMQFQSSGCATCETALYADNLSLVLTR